MNILLALALELASVISYDCKWSHNLEHHLLMTLEVSFTIVVCLQYRPQTTGPLIKQFCLNSRQLSISSSNHINKALFFNSMK
jgi:hypothetical protein